MLLRRQTGGGARHATGSVRSLRAFLATAATLAVVILGTHATQDAVANGETRTIDIIHEHTKESASITFRRDGRYDPDALKALNWLLRDWRLDEPTRMDPKLFDIVWQVYREVGSREPIHVVSGYRSPETNAALRRRSRAVAEYSQHIQGRAMDFFLPDVSMARVREIGMRLQNGGVGFYPNAYNVFVHLDAGSVRSWPRMSGGELLKLFPDGRTVHIPRNGKPLPGYEEAKATILARGGTVPGMGAPAEGDEDAAPRSFWAVLFGGGDDDAANARSAAARAPPLRTASAGTASARSAAAERGTRLASAEAPPPGLDRFGAETPERGAEPSPTPATPIPPRRPTGLGVARTVPPVRTFGLAALSAFPGASDVRVPPVAPDDRAALRSLFAAVVTAVLPAGPEPVVATSRARPRPLDEAQVAWRDPDSRVRTVFSYAPADPFGPQAFSGPAVAPLPILR